MYSVARGGTLWIGKVGRQQMTCVGFSVHGEEEQHIVIPTGHYEEDRHQYSV